MLSSLKALLLQHLNNMYLGYDWETLLLLSDWDGSTDTALKSLKTFEGRNFKRKVHK